MVDPYLFYQVMQYPLPLQREFFAYGEPLEGGDVRASANAEFPSWRDQQESGKQIVTYTNFIKRWNGVFRYIPFVEAIYLSNSITFNALHEKSDINIFVISNTKRLWHVRVWVSVALNLINIWNKRVGYPQISCKFYADRDALDFQTLKLKPHDPYMIYRIAHLVPIFHQFEKHQVNIFEENKWIQYFLPHHPLKQTIQFDIEEVIGVSKIRKFLEAGSSGYIGDIFERIIKTIMIPYLIRKTKKAGKHGEDYIISDQMIKFHHDKRKVFALKWKLARGE